MQLYRLTRLYLYVCIYICVYMYVYIYVYTYMDLINYVKGYVHEKEQEGVCGRVREEGEKRNVAIILSPQKSF